MRRGKEDPARTGRAPVRTGEGLPGSHQLLERGLEQIQRPWGTPLHSHLLWVPLCQGGVSLFRSLPSRPGLATCPNSRQGQAELRVHMVGGLCPEHPLLWGFSREKGVQAVC